MPRYRVRDIVSPHIEERLLTWRTLKNDPKEIVLAGPNSLQVTLSYEPFHLMVVVAGKPAITLNSRCGGVEKRGSWLVDGCEVLRDGGSHSAAATTHATLASR